MVVKSELTEIDRTVTIGSMSDFSKKLQKLTEELREHILAPRPRKSPPTFTSSQVAEMCGIDRARLHYLATKDGSTLPAGELHGRVRQFTLAETRKWVQQASQVKPSPLLRKGEADGRVLISANFKGGSCKTTSSMCLAQGLSLRGRKVLLVDLDPQASLTELCGLYAEKMIVEESTVLPYIYSPDDFTLESVIQETYWDGVDVIPAHPSLFSAEFHIPAMASKSANYRFWTLLRKGLEPLRKKYDYIVLDSAPSLSYLTINGLMAADAMVMPLVPESLDFISSVSFWSLFSDMADSFKNIEGNKTYDFVSILLSKVDYGVASSAPIVRSWVQRAYGDWMSPIEVPASSVMSNGALALATVFDISKFEGSNKTFQRVRIPFDEYCRWVDEFYAGKWEDA
ncbi:partitioning protein ParA (plasmid) [Cupriavidus necator N-1]|uniref:Partitioning protein ParA n=1 Tax=Cupriavidus necator (strain ATCC 43291 / DSM 13513 / CCUG 52238 / LMG 8453 / N-1) TaxID=1042878 RepID=F8GY79_CUPNN|nr:AAA family ATPase [Cupriavidus necator]AEI82820.1 partitioning protein ParA [Cupriavidus necator N-1]MDX6008616.1 AAA family ATPase [Cupriavidus necator]